MNEYTTYYFYGLLFLWMMKTCPSWPLSEDHYKRR
jgi:hypothetical protein